MCKHGENKSDFGSHMSGLAHLSFGDQKLGVVESFVYLADGIDPNGDREVNHWKNPFFLGKVS